jgi:hypothetical protein
MFSAVEPLNAELKTIELEMFCLRYEGGDVGARTHHKTHGSWPDSILVQYHCVNTLSLYVK